MATAYAEYAGVKLPLWTPDCDAAFARANLDPARLQRFAYYWTGPSIDGLPLPPRLLPPPFRGGSLWWPIGASNWASAHFIADSATLAEIRAELVAAAGSSTAGYPAADLVMNDGRGYSITAGMHLLPPTPLVGSDDLYLLTLVDDRYYWWQKPKADFSTVGFSGQAALDAIETALGIGNVVYNGTFNTFIANDRWYPARETMPLPLLLDALAESSQLRFTRERDGSCRIYNAAVAKLIANIYRGVWGLDSARRRGGGVLSADDVKKSVPASVTVRSTLGGAYTVTLASLSLTEYAGATGMPGQQATIWVEVPGLGIGGATALASEWYRWQFAGEDVSFAGIRTLINYGWYAGVEWTLRRDEVGTRIHPFPFAPGHVGSAPCYCGTEGSSTSPPPPSPPPPPPPTSGAVVGQVFSGGAGQDGRVVTISGATTGTATTTGGGNFSFSPATVGSNTVTLTLASGETATYQVDGGSVTAGAAAPVTVAAGLTNHVEFVIDADAAAEVTISGTVSLDGSAAPVVGRTVLLLGIGDSTTTDAGGGYSFTTFGGGTRSVQVPLGGGEVASHNVDSGGWAAGETGSVTISASTHDVDFRLSGTVIPSPPPPPPPVSPATVNVTVQNAVGGAGLSGRTVTIAGTSQTTNGSGQTTFTGVVAGSTSAVLTISGGESASWSVDTPSGSGKGATATFTSTNGGTHGVTFQVGGITEGGGSG